MNPDFLVFAVKQSSERLCFGFNAFGQSFIKGRTHRLLSYGQCVGGFASDSSGHVKHGGFEVLRTDHVVYEANSMGFVSGHHVAGHDHLVGLSVAHQAFKTLRCTVARNQSKVDFGCAKG